MYHKKKKVKHFIIEITLFKFVESISKLLQLRGVLLRAILSSYNKEKSLDSLRTLRPDKTAVICSLNARSYSRKMYSGIRMKIY